MYTHLAQNHIPNPRNCGPLVQATDEGIAGTPGDVPFLALWFDVTDGRIHQAAFRTYGCASAIASGSYVTFSYDAASNTLVKWQQGSNPMTFAVDAANRLAKMVQGSRLRTPATISTFMMRSGS